MAKNYEQLFAEEVCAIFVPDTSKYEFGNKDHACGFNTGVMCNGKENCGKCGWNPSVAKQRSYKIRRALREQNEG